MFRNIYLDIGFCRLDQEINIFLNLHLWYCYPVFWVSDVININYRKQIIHGKCREKNDILVHRINNNLMTNILMLQI